MFPSLIQRSSSSTLPPSVDSQERTRPASALIDIENCSAPSCQSGFRALLDFANHLSQSQSGVLSYQDLSSLALTCKETRRLVQPDINAGYLQIEAEKARSRSDVANILSSDGVGLKTIAALNRSHQSGVLASLACSVAKFPITEDMVPALADIVAESENLKQNGDLGLQKTLDAVRVAIDISKAENLKALEEALADGAQVSDELIPSIARLSPKFRHIPIERLLLHVKSLSIPTRTKALKFCELAIAKSPLRNAATLKATLKAARHDAAIQAAMDRHDREIAVRKTFRLVDATINEMYQNFGGNL